MTVRYIRACLCAPLGVAAMSVYVHSLGGAEALNLQQALLALILMFVPSALALTTHHQPEEQP